MVEEMEASTEIMETSWIRKYLQCLNFNYHMHEVFFN